MSLLICFIKHNVSKTSFTVLLTAKSFTFKLTGSVALSANCSVEHIYILKFWAKLESIVAVFFSSSPIPILAVSVFNVS